MLMKPTSSGTNWLKITRPATVSIFVSSLLFSPRTLPRTLMLACFESRPSLMAMITSSAE